MISTESSNENKHNTTLETLHYTTTLSTNNTSTFNFLTISNEDILDSEFELEQFYLSRVVPTLFGVISVVGLVGNLMVIVSVLLNRQMRHTTNLLIIHLALADLLFIVFCVPFTAVSYVITEWPFGDVWCKIYQYMNFLTAITSVYTLVLMSLDRYLAVCHPIQSIDIRSPRKTMLAIWVVTGIISVSLCPLLKDFATFEFAVGISRCVNVKIRVDPFYHKTFQICFFAFGFAIPLGLVCLLYGLMLRRLLYGSRNKRIAGKANQKKKKRITRLVVSVVTTFALCWLPIHIIFLMQASKRKAHQDETTIEEENDDYVFAQLAAQCLAYLNSCVNPFLYAFLSEQFRKSFLRLFDGCCSTSSLPVRIKATKPAVVMAATAMGTATSITNKQLLNQVPVQSFELQLKSCGMSDVNGKSAIPEKEEEENTININNGVNACSNQKNTSQDLNNNEEGVSIIDCQ